MFPSPSERNLLDDGSTCTPFLAMASSHSKGWNTAMNKEMASLEENEVSDLIPRTSVPAGCKVIGRRWAFKVKSDYTFKARFVCQGYAQRPGQRESTAEPPLHRSAASKASAC